MTAEQCCEGRDEFTNGSLRDQWVWGGRRWAVESGDGAGCGGRGEVTRKGSEVIPRAIEGKLSEVQPGFSLTLLTFVVMSNNSDVEFSMCSLSVCVMGCGCGRIENTFHIVLGLLQTVTVKVSNKVLSFPKMLACTHKDI